MNEPDAETVWAIRFTRRARADVDAAWDYFAATAGEPIADLWQEGLENAVASLAQMPGRCPAAQEAAHFPPPLVRQLIYRRTRGGPAYRVLFRMITNPDDASFVRIITVRHGAQAPLSSEEAISIEANE